MTSNFGTDGRSEHIPDGDGSLPAEDDAATRQASNKVVGHAHVERLHSDEPAEGPDDLIPPHAEVRRMHSDEPAEGPDDPAVTGG